MPDDPPSRSEAFVFRLDMNGVRSVAHPR